MIKRSARENAILGHLKDISDFVNGTDSDDPMWLHDQAVCNVAVDRIKSLISNCVDSKIIGQELRRHRFRNIVYTIHSDRIYVSAVRENICYGRDFLLDDLACEHDQMQYIIDWFTSHKLKELDNDAEVG